jgi:hypothetical protein
VTEVPLVYKKTTDPNAPGILGMWPTVEPPKISLRIDSKRPRKKTSELSFIHYI